MQALFPEIVPRDWADDPLYQKVEESRSLQSKVDEDTSKALNNWFVFHWSTRLKLEASEYHTKVIRYIHHAPSNSQEDTILDRLRRWQFDELFFQLEGAFDTLLQEINALYKLGIEPRNLNWDTFSKATKKNSSRPPKVARLLKRRWGTQWLVEIRTLRNATTHNHFAPFAGSADLYGGSWFARYIQWGAFELYESHKNDDRQVPEVCEDYLRRALDTITECWSLMLSEWPINA